jgi:hypothetical protein
MNVLLEGCMLGRGRAPETRLPRGRGCKHAAVQAWLADNPRISLHFTSTDCS